MSESYRLDLTPVPDDGRVLCTTLVLNEAEYWDRAHLLRTLARALETLRPRGDRVVWLTTGGETLFLSFTPRRRSSDAEVRDLARLARLIVEGTGRDYLPDQAKPVLGWIAGRTRGLFTDHEPAGITLGGRAPLRIEVRRGEPRVERRESPRGDERPRCLIRVPFRATENGVESTVLRLPRPELPTTRTEVSRILERYFRPHLGSVALWTWESSDGVQLGVTAPFWEQSFLNASGRGTAMDRRFVALPSSARAVAALSVDGVLHLFERMASPDDDRRPIAHPVVDNSIPIIDWFSGRPSQFRVLSLSLSAVRAFKTWEARFAPAFTVIIAEGGKGKSTILDACAAALSPVLDVLADAAPFALSPDDVHVEYSGAPGRPVQAVREQAAVVGGELLPTESPPLRLRAVVGAGAPKGYSVPGANWAQQVRAAVDLGAPIDLPVVVYYRAERQSPRRGRTPLLRRHDRLGPMDTWLTPSLSAETVRRWFRREVERNGEIVVYLFGDAQRVMSNVRSAVGKALPEVSHLWWDSSEMKFFVEFRGVSVRAFSELSDGHRATLGLLIDLAWRCALLNPHLADEAAARSPGVVLIDEIEKHLHPGWQRRVVGGLRAAFPRLQFVVTTHSPFIVQSVTTESVINLDRGTLLEVGRASVEDIVEQAMGVLQPQRSHRWHEMYRAAADFFERLENLPAGNDERAAALRRLDALAAPFADDPAFTAFLARKRGLVVR